MIDRLIEKIIKTGNPSCAGLDPTLEIMPEDIRDEMFMLYGKTPKAISEMFFSFNKGIIDHIYDILPAVKLQIAMYEKYGSDGIEAYMKTARYAKNKGLLVIGDIKRGDIASTALAYAAHIGGIEIDGEYFDLWNEDAVTVNPYLGTDSVAPFIKYCKEKDKGIFVLVKTSNKGSGELQDRLIDGEALYIHVADLVSGWGQNIVGRYGYSRVGAVVAATHTEQGKALRRRLPKTFFLVPGYGAQGGKGEDLKGYFDKEGLGVLVNSSRGIIGAHLKDTNEHFTTAARKAAKAMKEDLNMAMEG